MEFMEPITGNNSNNSKFDHVINWNQIFLAIIYVIPACLVAGAAYIQTVDTHKAVNSRMAEMIEITKKLAAITATDDEQRAQHLRELEAKIKELSAAREKK